MSAAVKTPPALEAPLNDTPMAEPPARAEERVTAFTIGANTYTFPAFIPVGWGLVYLRLYYGHHGPDGALMWLLTKLLGAEQHHEFEVDPGLTSAVFADFVTVCRTAVLGAFEVPKGSSPNA